MSRSILPILILAMVTGGCGPDEPCYPTAQLGSCCEREEDCGDLSCLASLPGGYCSRDCSQDHSCPEGGHCLEYQSSSGDLPPILCLVGCASGQPPCRKGYVCQLVTAIGSPVCVPGS